VLKLCSESQAPYKTRLISSNKSLQKVKNLHKFLHFDDSGCGEPLPFYQHKIFGDNDSVGGGKSETSFSPGYWEIFMEIAYREKHKLICE